jgi:hypothetical protein
MRLKTALFVLAGGIALFYVILRLYQMGAHE